MILGNNENITIEVISEGHPQEFVTIQVDGYPYAQFQDIDINFLDKENLVRWIEETYYSGDYMSEAYIPPDLKPEEFTLTLDILVPRVIEQLNEIQKTEFEKKGYTNSAFFTPEGDLFKTYKWNAKKKMKYWYLDAGTSGAFLVDMEGEIFNIRSSYGVPDRNKKKYADVGNLFTVDVSEMYNKRHQYFYR